MCDEIADVNVEQRIKRILTIMVKLGVWPFFTKREIGIITTRGGSDKIIADARARKFQRVHDRMPQIIVNILGSDAATA